MLHSPYIFELCIWVISVLARISALLFSLYCRAVAEMFVFVFCEACLHFFFFAICDSNFVPFVSKFENFRNVWRKLFCLHPTVVLTLWEKFPQLWAYISVINYWKHNLEILGMSKGQPILTRRGQQERNRSGRRPNKNRAKKVAAFTDWLFLPKPCRRKQRKYLDFQHFRKVFQASTWFLFCILVWDLNLIGHFYILYKRVF